MYSVRVRQQLFAHVAAHIAAYAFVFLQVHD